MSTITLVFVGLSILILLGLYLAARWLVPAVLADEHGEDENGNDGHAA